MEETVQTFLIGDDPDATILIGDDTDATMIAPRFDERESVTAQPVVPLADVVATEANALPPYMQKQRGARRKWPLALILVSALGGSALGMAGLYFYQQRRETPIESTPETQVERVSVPVATAQTSTTPAPVEERPVVTTDAPPATVPAKQQVERSAPSVAPVADDDSKARKENARDERDVKKKKDDDDTAATPLPSRKAVETNERTGTLKHGKKGESETRADEAAQLPQRPRRVETAPDDERTTRRIDTINYPENRSGRRARGQRSIDRVRGIFEGQPPR